MAISRTKQTDFLGLCSSEQNQSKSVSDKLIIFVADGLYTSLGGSAETDWTAAIGGAAKTSHRGKHAACCGTTDEMGKLQRTSG